MQDRCEQRRLRVLECVGDVLRVARAAGCDHRQRHGVADRLQLREVVALPRAVAVDARDEQLPGAARLALPCPLDRVARGVARRRVRADASVLRVDRDDDRL